MYTPPWGRTGFDVIEVGGTPQRVVAYHAGSRRDTPSATEQEALQCPDVIPQWVMDEALVTV